VSPVQIHYASSMALPGGPVRPGGGLPRKVGILGQTASAAYPGRTSGGPQRPPLGEVSRFIELEREVEIEYRPRMLEAPQNKVNAAAGSLRDQTPACPQCGQPMQRYAAETVHWLARFGRLHASVVRYRCRNCKQQRRPLLDLLGVEPGRIGGSLARLLALLAVVAPYTQAAQLAWQLLGVKISPMGLWKVVQRLGESVARHSEAVSQIPCRQPECRRTHQGRSAGGGAECGWKHVGHAGAQAAPAAQSR
jgi:hypothetical protein